MIDPGDRIRMEGGVELLEGAAAHHERLGERLTEKWWLVLSELELAQFVAAEHALRDAEARAAKLDALAPLVGSARASRLATEERVRALAERAGLAPRSDWLDLVTEMHRLSSRPGAPEGRAPLLQSHPPEPLTRTNRVALLGFAGLIAAGVLGVVSSPGVPTAMFLGLSVIVVGAFVGPRLERALRGQRWRLFEDRLLVEPARSPPRVLLLDGLEGELVGFRRLALRCGDDEATLADFPKAFVPMIALAQAGLLQGVEPEEAGLVVPGAVWNRALRGAILFGGRFVVFLPSVHAGEVLKLLARRAPLAPVTDVDLLGALAVLPAARVERLMRSLPAELGVRILPIAELQVFRLREPEAGRGSEQPSRPGEVSITHPQGTIALTLSASDYESVAGYA